jgi:Ca-activated chloride channel family protein
MILMALLLPVLIAMVAFAIEMGRMFLVRNQLQTAVDSGALAAGLSLRENPDDVDAALAAGVDFVQRNRAGAFVTVPADAIIIEAGKWDSVTRTFTPGMDSPDAIQVNGTLDKEPMFFGRAMGLKTFAMPRAAIAIGGGSPLDIIMTLDLSGSMGSQGRIEALRDAAPVFIDVLESVGDNDRVGVMGYGAMNSRYDPVARGHNGVKYTLAPQSLYPPNDDWCGVLEAELTFDLDYIRNSVLDSGTLQANKYNGWTPIGGALRDSCHYLSQNARPSVEKVVVLMSDGHANKPAGNGPGYALDMASYAVSLDIKVYTISLGNGADEDLMQQIADMTGGEHFIASGSAGELSGALTEAFAKIADAMKQTQLVQ